MDRGGREGSKCEQRVTLLPREETKQGTAESVGEEGGAWMGWRRSPSRWQEERRRGRGGREEEPADGGSGGRREGRRGRWAQRVGDKASSPKSPEAAALQPRGGGPLDLEEGSGDLRAAGPTKGGIPKPAQGALKGSKSPLSEQALVSRSRRRRLSRGGWWWGGSASSRGHWSFLGSRLWTEKWQNRMSQGEGLCAAGGVVGRCPSVPETGVGPLE